MTLKMKSNQELGLSDLLNYAHLVDEGIILNKDGAFLSMYRFSGRDLHSASEAELDAIAANFNRMVTFLDDGWMLHVDEVRIPSLTYPEKGAFPDPVSALIDEERRQHYEKEGAHFENIQLLTFVWKFPLSVVKKTQHWFVDGLAKNNDVQDLEKLLHNFIEMIERCIGLLSVHFSLKKLSSKELLSCLNTCITGNLLPVEVPPNNCFIDVVLGRCNVLGGYVPKVGNKYLYVISIIGYLNETTVPGLLESMGNYPMVYRWSNRFIPLSEMTAEREMKRYRKNWNNKVKGFVGIMKEAVFGQISDKINYNALEMSNQIDEALTMNSSLSTRWGYWTSEIVLFNEDVSILEEASKDLTRYIEQAGFACIKEDINAMDAWLGTIPGHGSCNVRRVFLNSLQLAHVLPLHTTWTGTSFSSHSSLLPPQSPPVFYAATNGKTPFRFHLDVADVGHQLVLGPTGAGKSTYLGFLIAQFLRYEKAQIFVFDKDRSHQALTLALGGEHYSIGHTEEPCFCPLANLSTNENRVRSEQFIEDLVALQNIEITPLIRSAIHAAIESLSSEVHQNSRSLTIFCNEVQNEKIREALRYYTLDGQFKLLDADHDLLNIGYLQTFEMGWLLGQKPEIYLPVLRYIFDTIDARLDESNGMQPTLIVLEEAWLYITHEVFAKKLKDWLKTLRKKNARVVFATQSLSDLYDPSTKSLTNVTAALLESCPTKIYLPNLSMEFEIEELYIKMGLTERQIEIISRQSIPKQDYYIVTPEGDRLINLGFNDLHTLTLSFVGLSKEASQLFIENKKQYMNTWLTSWLERQGLSEWIDSIENRKDIVC